MEAIRVKLQFVATIAHPIIAHYSHHHHMVMFNRITFSIIPTNSMSNMYGHIYIFWSRPLIPTNPYNSIKLLYENWLNAMQTLTEDVGDGDCRGFPAYNLTEWVRWMRKRVRERQRERKRANTLLIHPELVHKSNYLCGQHQSDRRRRHATVQHHHHHHRGPLTCGIPIPFHPSLTLFPVLVVVVVDTFH